MELTRPVADAIMTRYSGLTVRFWLSCVCASVARGRRARRISQANPRTLILGKYGSGRKNNKIYSRRTNNEAKQTWIYHC